MAREGSRSVRLIYEYLILTNKYVRTVTKENNGFTNEYRLKSIKKKIKAYTYNQCRDLNRETFFERFNSACSSIGVIL